ncbi:hypothetical protein [Nocardia africana]|uniref:hypothetical protein n=1 Tax=Nocardia africana TaxID=134964 RepID=UPI000B2E79B6|nr:hypothetical protein [Nocardia africana]MCC3315618.1 hypothetical protein [Nocardia africana]
MAKKIGKDFARAVDQWPDFDTWRFVRNAPVGPVASQTVVKLQRTFGPQSARPLTIRVFDIDKLWTDIVATLDMPS